VFHACLCQHRRRRVRPDAAYRDQLERVEVAVGTAARAAERLLDAQASGAYAVRDVDDAGEFLELPEERLGDERGVARAGRMAAHRSCRGGEEEEEEERTGAEAEAEAEEACSSGHEGWLSHIQYSGCRWRTRQCRGCEGER
jgi:hypothetical protein